MTRWIPSLDTSADMPRYIGIAEAIGADISQGRLRPGDRLPPQRRLAQELGVDYSTVSRAYAEAVRRGYVESYVGRGTFVRPIADMPTRDVEDDPKMNMPPEPSDPALQARMQEALIRISGQLIPLMRYQSTTGTAQDRDLALGWMRQNGLSPDPARLTIAPGAHAALYAILHLVVEPGMTVLCQELTYPGLRAIAAAMDLHLIGVAEDSDGLAPEALAAAIARYKPAALYLNPTLQNPTTATLSTPRRAALAGVLEQHQLPLIEDDAYCFVASNAPAPVSQLVPDLSWHLAGLSKCLGAGLRLAYVTVPDRSQKGAFSQMCRALNVMAPPLSLALAAEWIRDGTASELQAFLRSEARARQDLATLHLAGCQFQADPGAFNLWLTLPEGTGRAEILARMAGRQIGLMPSDGFAVTKSRPEALRVCLGGPISRSALAQDLGDLSEAVLRKDWLG